MWAYAFSPCMVATSFRVCFAARNSRYHMPCQVPVASLPLEMGMVTLAPMSADLTWACGCLHQQSDAAPDSACHHLHITNRHIIAPFSTMSVHIALLILRNNPIQSIAHVRPHVLVPVLIETQRTARVLRKQIE